MNSVPEGERNWGTVAVLRYITRSGIISFLVLGAVQKVSKDCCDQAICGSGNSSRVYLHG